MKLQRKLESWQAAGLIDAATAARIAAWEREQQRPIALYVFGGLGALSVALGVISVIAANWVDIPRIAKMIVFAALLGATAWGNVRVRAGQVAHGWLAEAAAVFYFGLILAGIALVGQTYQLGGDEWQALLLWLSVGSPVLLYAQSGFAALVWLMASVGTFATCTEALMNALSLSGDTELAIAAMLVGIGSVLSLWLASVPGLQRHRPAFAAAFERFGWSVVLIGGSISVQLAWYVDADESLARGVRSALPALIAAAAVTWWRLPYLSGALGADWLKPARAVVLFAAFGTLAGVSVPHDSLAPLGALSFLALWGLVAWFATASQSLRLLNLASAVLAGRLFIVYLEVFGSMLATGAGLIFSGLLFLGLVWLWAQKVRKKEGA